MTKRMTKAQRAQDDVQRFTCRGCKRRVPWSFGCDDEMPHHCDDCWAAVHAPTLVSKQWRRWWQRRSSGALTKRAVNSLTVERGPKNGGGK